MLRTLGVGIFVMALAGQSVANHPGHAPDAAKAQPAAEVPAFVADKKRIAQDKGGKPAHAAAEAPELGGAAAAVALAVLAGLVLIRRETRKPRRS